ncbi:MAG: hypothetical protein IPK87_05555 [Planctomycetes bacterium]|nr:hypothetical protein [Planctomycetota bacterium]
MSKRLKVRRLPAGVKLGQPATYSPADARPAADLPARQAFFNECYARFLKFFYIEALDEMIAMHRLTIRAHTAEIEARSSDLQAGDDDNYRWDISPSSALRAARALNETIDKRIELMTQARDAAMQCVEEKFGPQPQHDTAVTQQAAPEIPPPPKPAQAAPPLLSGMPKYDPNTDPEMQAMWDEYVESLKQTPELATAGT